MLNAEALPSQTLGGLPPQEISSPGTGPSGDWDPVPRCPSPSTAVDKHPACTGVPEARRVSILRQSEKAALLLAARSTFGYCHLSESVLALPPYSRGIWQPLLSATAITFWEELTSFSLKNSTDCMGVLVYVCVHSLHVHDLRPCTAHQHWTLVSGTRHRGTNVLDEVAHGAGGSGAAPEGNTSACWPEAPGSELMESPSHPRVSTLSLAALQPGPHLKPILQHPGLPVQGPVPGVPSPALWSGEKAAWDWTE